MEDISYGIIPLRIKEGTCEFFLVQHKTGHWWGFPKGHPLEGELPENAASRELFEETGLQPVKWLKGPPLVDSYSFSHDGRKIKKKVYYFIAYVEGEVVLQKTELTDGLWLPFEQACQLATYDETKRLFQQVASRLNLV